MGNCTRDPQVKSLPNGGQVADFGLAVNRKYRTAGGEDKEETCFVDVTAFGKQAETIGQYVTKGKPLFIEGRLKFDQWEDKTGGKRSKLSVIVNNFQFIGGRDGGDAGDDAPPRGQQQRPQQGNNRPAPANRGNGNGGGNRARETWGPEGDDFTA